MKAFIAFAFLVVGISANVLPASEFNPIATQDERLVTGAIIEAIEEVSQSIKDAGLDPLIIKREVFAYELPVPVIFNAAAFVEEVLSTGLSEIVINRMNYAVLASRLDFDIELPHIRLSASRVNAEATLFRETADARLDGRIDVRGLRVIGEVRVNIGIISGISIRSVRINFSIGSINTNIRLAIQGKNYSEQINEFLGSTIPDLLGEFKDEINELIEIILLDVLNDAL